MTHRRGSRKEPEEDQPDLHRALAAEAVADSPTGQEQPSEGQAVDVHDPLKRRDVGPQAAIQGGQGHVHDGVVHDHQ